MVFDDSKAWGSYRTLMATESDLEHYPLERNLGERRVEHGSHVQEALARREPSARRR